MGGQTIPMQRITHPNSVITYTFDSLAGLPIRAHVSTRHGGVSPAPWNTLNFSVSRGDTPERVAQNRACFAQAVDVQADQVVRCHQVHGTGIAKVDSSDAGTFIEQTDGLITDVTGLPLAWVFADCTPILLYDKANHILGGCHAGWRGTVNGAAAATLWAMQAAYGTDPGRVVACIGPSIGPQSYEVGEEVINMARAKLHKPERFFATPATAAGGSVTKTDANLPSNLDSDTSPLRYLPETPEIDEFPAKLHFDLWRANAEQLIEAGVPAEQIEISEIDTAQNIYDFFSHRAEKGQCGLFSMMAWLA